MQAHPDYNDSLHFEASHGNVQIILLSKSIAQLWMDLNIIQHNNPIDF